MALDTRAKKVSAATAIACCIAMPAEGLRQYAYKDPVGILTVCYGSTTDVVPGRQYSLDECRARLDDEMTKAVEQVNRCVPGLPEHVLAAFADTAYNVGPRIACDTKNSTAARMLAAGRIPDACNQLPRWNKATVAGVPVELPGLTKRRAKARDLCLNGTV